MKQRLCKLCRRVVLLTRHEKRTGECVYCHHCYNTGCSTTDCPELVR